MYNLWEIWRLRRFAPGGLCPYCKVLIHHWSTGEWTCLKCHRMFWPFTSNDLPEHPIDTLALAKEFALSGEGFGE